MSVTTRPILFSAPMVRAILNGMKTQTRRTVKLAIGLGRADCVFESYSVDDGACFRWGGGNATYMDCPYGLIGSRLWVRETWATTEQSGMHANDAYVVYRATDPDWETMEGWRWRPSIFMPRSASRITLEITDLRVERVQGISVADIEAEGFCPAAGRGYINCAEAIQQFSSLWNKINGKKYPWKSNPWVWVLGFKVIEK